MEGVSGIPVCLWGEQNSVEHKSLELALGQEARRQGKALAFTKELSEARGVLLAPNHPYAKEQHWVERVYQAARLPYPFLATSLGFQYTLLAYLFLLREEEKQRACVPLRLAHFAVDVSEDILFPSPSLLQKMHATSASRERIHYQFSMGKIVEDLIWQSRFLEVCGVDVWGSIRAVSLRDHPFFIATSYVPGGLIFPRGSHPILRKFVEMLE